MKDLNEILSHVNAIAAADQRQHDDFWPRKKNIEALACKVADELIAGRPVPVFNQAESITRIDGMLPELANELVSQHDMAIAHRTHLAERLEADGGENGAKAAAILRGMNAPADSKDALLRARGDTFASIPMTTVQDFTGHQVSGVAREPFWVEDIDEADIQQGDIVEYHGVNRWSVLCRSDIRTPDGTPSGRVQLQLQLLDGPIHATECVYLPLPGEPRVMRPVEG